MKSNCNKVIRGFHRAITSMAVVVFLVGCNDGLKMIAVQGTVMIDGKLLEQGAITFEPIDGKGPSAGTTIKDGSYTAKVPPGEKKVRITGFEVVGQRPAYPNNPNGPMRDIIKEVVPRKYNINSELTKTIDSSMDSTDFELESS